MATYFAYSVPATNVRWDAIGTKKALMTWLRKILVNLWTMAICKLVIGTVSAYDTYLTIKYADFLNQYESNPIGRWIMNLDSGPVSDLQQIAAFVTAKFAGTVLVVIVLQVIETWRVHMAAMIAIPVTMFQIYLGCYLTVATY